MTALQHEGSRVLTSRTDERVLAGLEAELRPLVETVRIALEDVLTAPDPNAARFLSDSPVVVCMRLTEVWSRAQSCGVTAGKLLARFPADDQLLIEMITGVYETTRLRPALTAVT